MANSVFEENIIVLRKEDCFACPVYLKKKILLLLLDMPFCALRMDKKMREQSYLWTLFKHLKLLSFSPSIRQASLGTSGIVLKQRHPPCLRGKESLSCHTGKEVFACFCLY